MSLELTELDDDYSIVRLDSQALVPSELLRSTATFVSISRSATELSVIGPTRLVALSSSLQAAERSDSWRCLRVETATLPSATPGIIASLVGPLAEAGISTFAVATFDTDHLLVRDVEQAQHVLEAAGHAVARTMAPNGDGRHHARTELSMPRANSIRIREASEDDSASLALLADAATRRLSSWLWNQSATAGQPNLEVGRDVVRSDTDSPYHLSRWRVAERDGQLAGALNVYVLRPSVSAAPAPEVAAVLQPIGELKALAAGTIYVGVASVMPEYQGSGVGHALIAEAERFAHAAGVDRVTLLVASFNEGARLLYERLGFIEWERRRFVPFPGSDPEGDWILMLKKLN